MTDDLSGRGEDTSPLKGEPTNADELVPQEHQPDPPEGGNRQPRQPRGRGRAGRGPPEGRPIATQAAKGPAGA